MGNLSDRLSNPDSQQGVQAALVESVLLDEQGTLATGSSDDPLMDGTTAPGTSAEWAHGDHVHPTDTTRGPANPPLKTVSSSYSAELADEIILYSGVMDGSQGITLPTAKVRVGKVITVKVVSTDAGGSALNVNTGNAGEYAANPQLFSIPAGAAIGGVASLIWDGSAWWLLEYSQ
jgi:hypothetical protein